MLNFFKNLLTKKPQDKTALLRFKLDNGEMHEEIIKLDDFDERISDLQKKFHQPKALSEIAFIHCLVGNIIEQRFDKNLNKIVLGTKYFSPRTKVYCYPPMWGDGYENIKVIGRHRRTARLITMVISSDRVTNWRLKTIYNPFVIKEMTENMGWTDKESDRDRIIEMLQWLNKA